METALLYHIEWLVWFYTLIGASCVYFSSSLTGMAGCLLLTWASGGNHYLAPPLLPLHSSMALILTANAMFSALNVVFGFVVVGRIKSNLGVYQAGLFASALVVGVIGGRLYAPCTFLFLLYGFLLIHLASLSGAHPAVNVRRERALAAWLTPLIVLFVGSDLILSVKTLAVHVDSWPLLALFPFLVVLRLWIVPKQPPPRLIQVIQMMCMLWLGSGAVVRPFFGIHPVAAFITVLVSLDIIIVKRSFPKSC